MIKIMKNGTIPKKYRTIYRATCRNCKCEFEFEQADCNETHKKDKSLEAKTYFSIDCPCCKEPIGGALDDLPRRREELTDEEIIEECTDTAKILLYNAEPLVYNTEVEDTKFYTTFSDTLDCENCPHYHTLSDACTFCFKNKFKVTCDTAEVK